MTVVNLTAAREHADYLETTLPVDGRVAVDWIRELADEVESLQGALVQERLARQSLAERLGAARDQRDDAIAALDDFLYRADEL